MAGHKCPLPTNPKQEKQISQQQTSLLQQITSGIHKLLHNPSPTLLSLVNNQTFLNSHGIPLRAKNKVQILLQWHHTSCHITHSDIILDFTTVHMTSHLTSSHSFGSNSQPTAFPCSPINTRSHPIVRQTPESSTPNHHMLLLTRQSTNPTCRHSFDSQFLPHEGLPKLIFQRELPSLL